MQDIISKLGIKNLSKEEHIIIDRARKIEKFMTQPFFSAEFFTGESGKSVKLEDTIVGCNMILNGELDDLPEDAFYLAGNIDDVKAKADEIKGNQ